MQEISVRCEIYEFFIEKLRAERTFIEAALDGHDIPEAKKMALLALMDERLSRFGNP